MRRDELLEASRTCCVQRSPRRSAIARRRVTDRRDRATTRALHVSCRSTQPAGAIRTRRCTRADSRSPDGAQQSSRTSARRSSRARSTAHRGRRDICSIASCTQRLDVRLSDRAGPAAASGSRWDEFCDPAARATSPAIHAGTRWRRPHRHAPRSEAEAQSRW